MLSSSAASTRRSVEPERNLPQRRRGAENANSVLASELLNLVFNMVTSPLYLCATAVNFLLLPIHRHNYLKQLSWATIRPEQLALRINQAVLKPQQEGPICIGRICPVTKDVYLVSRIRRCCRGILDENWVLLDCG